MKVHSNGLFFRLFYVAPCDLLGVAPCDEPFLSPCQPWHRNSTRSRSGISVGVLGGFHLKHQSHSAICSLCVQHESQTTLLQKAISAMSIIILWILFSEFWMEMDLDLDHCPFRWFPPGYFLWLFAFNPTHAAAPARSRQRDEGWPVEGFHDFGGCQTPILCQIYI